MLRMAGFALMLSSRCLTALIQAWGLPSEVATMLTSTTYNLSRHLHFDNATGKPWAICRETEPSAITALKKSFVC